MASEVSICNIALSHLGDEATVTSIDPPEGSQQAEYCATFYPVALDAILEDHSWSFATKRRALTLHSEDPPESWGYTYAFPGDAVRLRAVVAPDATDDTDSAEYIVEALSDGTKVIYTNVEDAVARYTYRCTDTGKYTPSFVLALARRLAAFLAGPIIKGSEGVKVGQEHLKVYFQVDLPKATTSDSNQGRRDTYDTFVPSLLKARR